MLQGQPDALLFGETPYGYGVMNMTKGPLGVLVGHSGQSFGFQCQLFYHVETDTVYAVVVNDSMQDAEQILLDLINAIQTQGWPELAASTATGLGTVQLLWIFLVSFRQCLYRDGAILNLISHAVVAISGAFAASV
eukprot:CAMPEP_0179243544 /NCGR_PEP_ID=MMETSP0797-20121207/17593_1 /TAXON_ID=47934 /ORGANISM="Dinophysis acuminata, Strain DAEP01" /LENGTH=135 /DNA_ID=CAMNT_0020951025 /DNA_START=35 /DNA_END=438 /DNA_ORIENTATION=+